MALGKPLPFCIKENFFSKERWNTLERKSDLLWGSGGWDYDSIGDYLQHVYEAKSHAKNNDKRLESWRFNPWPESFYK